MTLPNIGNIARLAYVYTHKCAWNCERIERSDTMRLHNNETGGMMCSAVGEEDY